MMALPDRTHVQRSQSLLTPHTSHLGASKDDMHPRFRRLDTPLSSHNTRPASHPAPSSAPTPPPPPPRCSSPGASGIFGEGDSRKVVREISNLFRVFKAEIQKLQHSHAEMREELASERQRRIALEEHVYGSAGRVDKASPPQHRDAKERQHAKDVGKENQVSTPASSNTGDCKSDTQPSTTTLTTKKHVHHATMPPRPPLVLSFQNPHSTAASPLPRVSTPSATAKMPSHIEIGASPGTLVLKGILKKSPAPSPESTKSGVATSLPTPSPSLAVAGVHSTVAATAPTSASKADTSGENMSSSTVRVYRDLYPEYNVGLACLTRVADGILGMSIHHPATSSSGSGVFVKTISAGGVVDTDGSLHIDDQILCVNGVNFANMTRKDAVLKLKELGPRLAIIYGRSLLTSTQF